MVHTLCIQLPRRPSRDVWVLMGGACLWRATNNSWIVLMRGASHEGASPTGCLRRGREAQPLWLQGRPQPATNHEPLRLEPFIRPL